MKDLATLANNYQIQDQQSPIGNGYEPTPYEKQITVYAFTLLNSVYLKKFSMTFASTEELQAARRQWARNFGQISRAQLEKGIERLKREMERGNKTFEWPNIPAFIGLCKQSSPPEHKVFDASKALPAKPWAERQAQATLHIQGIKRSIFKKAAK